MFNCRQKGTLIVYETQKRVADRSKIGKADFGFIWTSEYFDDNNFIAFSLIPLQFIRLKLSIAPTRVWQAKLVTKWRMLLQTCLKLYSEIHVKCL